MLYIYQRGIKRKRVMHIAATTRAGELTMQSLCCARLPFDTTINAPFALGRKVCKRCLHHLNNHEQ